MTGMGTPKWHLPSSAAALLAISGGDRARHGAKTAS
jgi:hypothetical protein